MNNINHPKHYNSHVSGVEAIEICEHLSFNLGNAVKYLFRADHKGSAIDDLRKASWYIAREMNGPLGPRYVDDFWRSQDRARDVVLADQSSLLSRVLETLLLATQSPTFSGMFSAHRMVVNEIAERGGK